MPERSTAHVLLVDDDPYIRESLREHLEGAGHVVTEASDGKVALDAFAAQPPALVLLDLDLPRVSGMEVLRRLVDERPEVPVVIISGKGGIAEAVEATKLGAYDFLEKPVDPQRALLTVRNALDKRQLQRERDTLLGDARARYRMVGTSPPMRAVYRLIDRAARVPSKVLIQGESGTGKERVARAIHLNSDRAAGPFVAVNCAALPDDLIESELFGHEKGAFTGAHAARPGAFEQAQDGTLFLDEIGDMSLMAQAKVLRVLEEGRVRRVGARRETATNARVIAATNKDLSVEVEAGAFRDDLYWRLNVVAVVLPPLRERRADIPALVLFFLERVARDFGVVAPEVDRAALALLVGHDWTGNVRQLRNAVERLVVMAEGETITGDEVNQALSLVSISAPDGGEELLDLRAAREAFERAHIQRVLLVHEGRVQEAAAALGIDRSHLWKKMQRLGVEG